MKDLIKVTIKCAPVIIFNVIDTKKLHLLKFKKSSKVGSVGRTKGANILQHVSTAKHDQKEIIPQHEYHIRLSESPHELLAQGHYMHQFQP